MAQGRPGQRVRGPDRLDGPAADHRRRRVQEPAGAPSRPAPPTYAQGDTDLAWTRITLWRGLLAAALDQPPFEPVVEATVSGGSRLALDRPAGGLAGPDAAVPGDPGAHPGRHRHGQRPAGAPQRLGRPRAPRRRHRHPDPAGSAGPADLPGRGVARRSAWPTSCVASTPTRSTRRPSARGSAGSAAKSVTASEAVREGEAPSVQEAEREARRIARTTAKAGSAQMVQAPPPPDDRGHRPGQEGRRPQARQGQGRQGPSKATVPQGRGARSPRPRPRARHDRARPGRRPPPKQVLVRRDRRPGCSPRWSTPRPRAERSSVVLTGGSLGSAILASVRGQPGRDAVDWSAVDVWWGDERFLPEGDPERNETQNREALLDALPLDPAQGPRDARPRRAGRRRRRGGRRGGMPRGWLSAAGDGAPSPTFDMLRARRRPRRPRRLAVPRASRPAHGRVGDRLGARLAQAAADAHHA